jgi:hypothetical protein
MLDAQLHEIDSDTYGGLYFRGRSGRGNEVFVHRNFDPIEDEWHAPEHQDLSIIVKVFYSDRPASVVAADLEGAVGSPTRVIGEYVG